MSRPNRRLKNDGPVAPVPGSRAQHVVLALMRVSFVVVALIGITLLSASVWQAFVAIDALKLTTVELKGAQRTHKAALLSAAGTEYGAPLLAIDLKAAAAGMSAHPWVRTATLRRQLPNRLHIDVQEHSPKALLMQNGLMVVNTLGEPFKPFSSDDGIVLPAITGLAATDNAALQEAIALLDAVQAQYSATFAVLQVHVDEDLGYTLYMRHLAPAFIDGAGNAEEDSLGSAMVVHLGHAPKNRVPLIGETLSHLVAPHIVPAVIWANGERAPNRIQVQPALAPQ